MVVLNNQERGLPPHTGISCKILPLLSLLPVSTPGEETAQERGKGEVSDKKNPSHPPQNFQPQIKVQSVLGESDKSTTSSLKL